MDVKDIIIDESYTISEVIKKIDKTAKRILLVERDEKLVGVITDGDIRRFILKNGDLRENCKDIINRNPVTIKSEDRDKALKIMKKYSINSVPVVDKNKKIKSVIFWDESEMYLPMFKNGEKIPVVIMAGGLGTRLYPYTKILPKPLIPIGDIPIVERIINKFQKFNIDKVYLTVNHKKNMIKSYFNDHEMEYDINFVEEEKPLGTGGSLYLLKNQLKETFFLTNCDILIDSDYSDIYRMHKESGNTVTIVAAMKNTTIPYGVIKLNGKGEIEEMDEKPEMSFMVNTGMYVVEPEVLDFIKEDEFIGFPDVIERCREKGFKVSVYPVTEESWMDMGELDEMQNMINKLGVK